MRSFVALFLALFLLPSIGFADQLEDNQNTHEHRDYQAELKIWRTSADKGNAVSETNVGNAYYWGLGVEKNFKEAVAWYLKAAEQGDAVAQLNLGVAYHYGTGVEKNDKEAVNWWLKAAQDGDPDAQTFLGDAYYNGEGVEKDFEEAVNWYRKAADEGNSYGEYNLGTAYMNGTGVEKDTEQAVSWWIKAATHSNDKARDALRNYYERLPAHEVPHSDLNTQSASNDTSDGAVLLIFLFTLIIGLVMAYLMKSRPPFDPSLLTDTTRPEPERRFEVIQALINKGWIVQNQQSGLVTAVKQKRKFDILGFIVLSLLCLLPGIIYLVYYATKRDKVQQYLLAQ